MMNLLTRLRPFAATIATMGGGLGLSLSRKSAYNSNRPEGNARMVLVAVG